MNRRHFSTLAALGTLATLRPGAVAWAAEEPGFLTYAPGMPDELLAQGKTILMDFSATWCTTCQAQGRAITALRAENPAYDAAITFVRVDWDMWGDKNVATDLAVQRRSTLIVISPKGEVSRLIAGTSQDQIRDLLDAGVAAAQPA